MKQGRRQAREDALKVLYQLDRNQDLTAVTGMAVFEKCFKAEGIQPDEFTHLLVQGVAENLKELDVVIDGASDNWRSDRMAVVDRTLLRIGVFELKFCDDVPATVTINEMVELAKSFGSEQSPAFINGVLDKVKSGLSLKNKAP